MKNFLKSTAIFACMAYLFCACTEDSTVDADIPMVDPSQITAVLSGDSRALIQWEVPDDQNITECMVTWKNNKNVNEIEYVPVIPGYSAEIEFYDLTEGDYDLTVTNLGENRALIDTQGASLEGTYIYSDVTYPNRPNVMRVLTESDAITITWSQIPQHCRGVYVTYTDTASVTKTTSLQNVVNPTEIETSVGTTTVQTKLNDAQPGSDFYYVTTFKPLDGLDTVYLAASETPSVISEYVAANPESLEIQGGCDPEKYTTYSSASSNNGGNVDGGGAYLKLKWKVPSADSIIYSTIYYNLLDDNGSVIEENSLTFGMEGEFLPTTDLYTTTYKENDFIVQGNVNTRYIEIAQEGYYQIFIQNMKKGGLVSEAVEYDIPVLAYNASTFDLPEAYELLKDTNDQLDITWYDTPEHFSSMILSYVNSELESVESSIITANDSGDLDNTILEKVVTDNQIELTVTYLPENGLDEVVLVSEEGEGTLIVPGNASETPVSSITVNPGYNTERGAYVKVVWDVTWPNDGGVYTDEFRAASLRLYYGLSSERTAEYIELPSLDTEEWYIDNLDPDLEFKIDLVSVTEDGTISARTSDYATTYNAATYTYDDCPEAKAVLLEGDVTFDWGLDYASALQSVTFTCSGVERTTEVDGTYVPATVIDGTGFESGSTYTYDYAIFCPEGGLDEITVAINETCSITVPDIVYDAIWEVCTIYSEAGFKAFADLVNGEKNYSAQTYGMNGDFPDFGTALTSLDANLYCDIDISSTCAQSSYGWYAIGNGGAYTGTFDGQGNSISGLYMLRPDDTYQGLFKYLTAGTIKNLTLVDPYLITGDFSAILVGQIAYSGGVALVENCHVIGGSIVNDEGDDGTSTNISLGSITSRNYGSIVKDCTSSATVYIPEGQGSNNSNNGVGGIVGVNTRSGTSSPYGEVVGCTFTGIVFGQISAAGIVACNTGGYVSGCTNYGFIKGGSYVGGVTGFNTGSSITAVSVNHGNILGSGGLTAGTIGRQAAYMYGCYNTGVYVCTNTSQITIGLITGYSPTNAGVETGNTAGNYFYYNKYDVVDFLKSLYSDGYITTLVDYDQIITGEEDEDEETSLPYRYNVYWAFGGTVSNTPGTNVTGAGQDAGSITGLNTAVNSMNTASKETVWASIYATGSYSASYTYYFMPGAVTSTDYPYPVQYE